MLTVGVNGNCGDFGSQSVQNGSVPSARSIFERLEEVIDELEGDPTGKIQNANQWCEAAGIGRSYLSARLGKWKAGKARGISPLSITKLAEAAGLNEAWLAFESGPKWSSSARPPRPKPAVTRHEPTEMSPDELLGLSIGACPIEPLRLALLQFWRATPHNETSRHIVVEYKGIHNSAGQDKTQADWFEEVRDKYVRLRRDYVEAVGTVDYNLEPEDEP